MRRIIILGAITAGTLITAWIVRKVKEEPPVENTKENRRKAWSKILQDKVDGFFKGEDKDG